MREETLKKFLCPESIVKEYDNWLLLCRFKQTTLGSLILICKDDVTAFSDISPASFAEFSKIVPEIETKLQATFGYEKINYLMLMMYDPEVHFHIIPRYAEPKTFEGITFPDAGWPNAPALETITQVDPQTFQKLVDRLKAGFAQ
jgi:diadenosine tetraphosphate (Ap4A) HIT family hydrolase